MLLPHYWALYFLSDVRPPEKWKRVFWERTWSGKKRRWKAFAFSSGNSFSKSVHAKTHGFWRFLLGPICWSEKLKLSLLNAQNAKLEFSLNFYDQRIGPGLMLDRYIYLQDLRVFSYLVSLYILNEARECGVATEEYRYVLEGSNECWLSGVNHNCKIWKLHFILLI